MCQLCVLDTISKRDRWPTPLQASKANLAILIATAHSETAAFNKAKARGKASLNDGNAALEPGPDTATGWIFPATVDITDEAVRAARKSLLTTLSAIFATLRLLGFERSEWWKSKAEIRKQWEEQLLVSKITAQQVISNKTIQMIMDMQAQVGKFARWGLGVEDVEALESAVEDGLPENGKDPAGGNVASGQSGLEKATPRSQPANDREERGTQSRVVVGASDAEKKLENARKLREMIEGQAL